MENKTYLITKEDEKLYIKEILRNKFRFSGRFVKRLKFSDEPLVFVDGKPVPLWYKGKAGETLEIRFPEEHTGFEPQDVGLKFAFEDDDVVVVDKPAGILTHPTTNITDHTLTNGLALHMQEMGESYRPHLVNRLDMNTSGLVIVGKNSHSQAFLNDEMLANRVLKNYVALVEGRLEGKGTIDAPIGREEDHMARRAVRPDGQPSVTHYEVLENVGDDFTLVKLKLDTGRTHQIRCHMRYLGHPIVGDELYLSKYYPDLMTRQALHACHIEFTHPITRELVSCDSDIPLDMLNCLKNLGFRSILK